jgi:hypothetical protein
MLPYGLRRWAYFTALKVKFFFLELIGKLPEVDHSDIDEDLEDLDD